ALPARGSGPRAALNLAHADPLPTALEVVDVGVLSVDPSRHEHGAPLGPGLLGHLAPGLAGTPPHVLGSLRGGQLEHAALDRAPEGQALAANRPQVLAAGDQGDVVA